MSVRNPKIVSIIGVKLSSNISSCFVKQKRWGPIVSERLSTIDLVGDFNHPMNYFVTYDEVSKNFVWNRRKGIQES